MFEDKFVTAVLLNTQLFWDAAVCPLVKICGEVMPSSIDQAVMLDCLILR
jgi:hypothetical protein